MRNQPFPQLLKSLCFGNIKRWMFISQLPPGRKTAEGRPARGPSKGQLSQILVADASYTSATKLDSRPGHFLQTSPSPSENHLVVVTFC